MKTTESTFIALVQSLLKDPAERAYFFQVRQNSDLGFPLNSAVIRAGHSLPGGVSSAVRTAIRHCSACVTVGDAYKTGKYASSTRFEAGIQCFTCTSEALCHPPTGITEQAVIADCELARLHPCSGGMYSALT